MEKKLSRKKAREAVLCMLFDYSFHDGEAPEELLDLYLGTFYDKKEKTLCEELRTDAYFSKVYFGVIANLAELDGIITECSKKWSSRRISRVTLSILRIALYEIRYVEDVPTQVAINEAVELAKKFDSDDSYTFVNGVLGAAEKLMKKCGEKPEETDGDNA